MASTGEIPLGRSPRPASEAEEPTSSGDPLPMASTDDAGAAVAMACTTCGKKGDHVASDCPYRDLLDNGSPPAAHRASPGLCPVCKRNPDHSAADSRVRVTNLPEDTSEADLRDLCSPFGPLDSVFISSATDEQPGSQGRFGIVEFYQAQDGEQAIDWLDGDAYGGHVLRVEWAAPFVPPPICERCLRQSETFIRVTNLSERTCEDDLYNLSCPFGSTDLLHIAADEETGSRRQVGIIEFVQRDDAEQAVRWLNGHVFDDLVLRVEGPLKILPSSQLY